MLSSNLIWRSPAALVLVLCCFSSRAHDFWVQPNEYWVDPEAATSMTVQVGHGPARQRSPIPMRRITRFVAFAPDGAVIDLRSDLHLGGKADDGTLRFEAPGAYVLVLETDNHAHSHLPASRFNDYLREEGLTPALEHRATTQRMDQDGAENYRRVAKAIMQVGPTVAASQTHVTKPLGLALEIVPERNPYDQPAGANLPVRVIYEGQPLAGALVKLTHVEQDASVFEMHVTDETGRTSFTLPTAGSWRLNVIWTKPLPSGSEAEFETVFSSLSFGFPR